MLPARDRAITSAVWFPLHSKGSGADYICTPAPVHNADGSESPWCFTRPDTLYDELQTKLGPDSKVAKQAVAELDAEIGKLVPAFASAYSEPPLWLVASEYAIVPVDNVVYPNRVLREAGLLKVSEAEDGEHLDFTASKARSGDTIIVSEPSSWQAYYWWEEDARAPQFARTVDIHRKPGYDPVELFFDARSKSIPLNAKLVKGSHGAPARNAAQRGVLLSSEPGVFTGGIVPDVDIAEIVMRQFALD
jgi:hypothetical protein